MLLGCVHVLASVRIRAAPRPARTPRALRHLPTPLANDLAWRGATRAGAAQEVGAASAPLGLDLEVGVDGHVALLLAALGRGAGRRLTVGLLLLLVEHFAQLLGLGL